MRILFIAIALTVSACSASRTGPPPAPIDRAALAEKAERAERRVRERFLSPEGLLVYRQPSASPPDLSTGPYGNFSDMTCWGGYLLGAEALRYRVTGDAPALAAVERVLDGLLLLERATGISGLLARSVDRNLSPEEASQRNGRWRRAAVPGYHYRGDVSKDQYAGALFGLGCVLAYCPEGEIRSRAAGLLVAIAGHFEAGGIAIRDVGGEVTTHGDLSDRFLGFPLGVNASLALAAFRLSAEAGGPPAHRDRYQDLVARGYARSASFAKVKVLGKTDRDNDHMASAGLYHLFRLERDPELRELYRRGLARIAVGVRGEENAYFLGLHMASSGPDPDLVAEAWSALARLPVEQFSGPVDLRGRVRGVVPIELRPASSFVWRSDPYRLTKDPEGTRPRQEYAPIDFLLAYWLLRAHGLE